MTTETVASKKPAREITVLFRSRRTGFEQHCEGQDTEGNFTHTPIQLPIQQRPQNRGLERHGSSHSAPPTPKRPAPVEPGTQEVQPGFTLGRTGDRFQKICLREMSSKDLMYITKGWNTNRKFRLLEEREAKIRGNKATLKAIEER
ncbi:hypothetical protein O181_003476 [Austropuccinia psidii MF-1]|uniref:Uncharacterized protein n=1 Tax=Austropuccinia psidii MF-1 TaxID=1389203 RepID=A0A9Q3BF16_9BASI|nr:hypothetical protein [Austropuccinia psidii MF-1]